MNEPRRQFGGAIPRAGGVEIDEGLRQYMLGVYNYMALGVAATGLFSMFIASNPSLMMAIMTTPLKWVGFIGILGLGWFAPRVIMNGSKVAAHAMFWVYAALWGVMIAPMLFVFQQQGAAVEIYKAFFITASVFGAVSLYGYTTKRNLSAFAQFFFMATVGLLIAIVVNVIFFQSELMSLITSCLVVLVFSGITAWETQAIKSFYQQGSAMNERTAIMGAFMLYGSFVTLFIHILNILGIMRD